jgi:hypothetical protein
MRSTVAGALALGVCAGCLVQTGCVNPRVGGGAEAVAPPIVQAPADATSASMPAPAEAARLEAPGAPAAQTGAIAPVLIPMKTLLIEGWSSGDTVTSSKDLVVHSRQTDNDFDPAMGEKRLGFTGVVSPLGMASQVSAGPDSTQAIAMSMGIGIFRGSRPRLTTGVVSGGAEGSTIIAYASQNSQWICLVEGSLVGAKRGTFTMITAGQTWNFVDNMTIIVATRPSPTGAWTVDGPRALNTSERTVCQSMWAKAQAKGIIPSTEPFPP